MLRTWRADGWVQGLHVHVVRFYLTSHVESLPEFPFHAATMSRPYIDEHAFSGHVIARFNLEPPSKVLIRIYGQWV